MARDRKKIIDIASAVMLLALVVLDVALWKDIFISARGAASTSHIYFLPVTHGDSSLLVLPNGVTALTDAGSDVGVVDDLQKALPPGDGSYIDLAIISSPQPADYEGYVYLLQHYRFGAFLYNGRADAAYGTEWKALMAAIAAKHIPLITLAAGDRIRYGADASVEAEIDILSPDAVFVRSPDPKDTTIIQRVVTPTFTAFLPASSTNAAIVSPKAGQFLLYNK